MRGESRPACSWTIIYVAGETQEETERAMQLALLVYRLAGWNIQWKKTTTKAEQQVRYLGVQIDTKRMEYKLPQDKERDILANMNKEWQCGRKGEWTTAREAAEMLGVVGGLQDHTRTSVAHYE